MIVAIHQPDFLPYSGFWFKMLRADAFILAVHDQFQKHGYQRHVTMRDSWVSHQLVGKPALVPIDTIEVRPGWQGRVSDSIRGRYAGARHWKARGPELLDRIGACEGVTLAEVNTSMIHVVRDLLDIRTPLLITEPPAQAGVERLIEQVTMVGGDAYLSGTGAHAYLGDEGEARFAEEGIELVWSNHAHATGDSIVTVLMDYDEPLEVILREAPAAS